MFNRETGKLTRRLGSQGAYDKGDIEGVTVGGEPVAIECKSPGKESQWSISGWWKETVRESHHVGSGLGFLVVKVYGKSADHALVITDLATAKECNLTDRLDYRYVDVVKRVDRWKDAVADGGVIGLCDTPSASWVMMRLDDFARDCCDKAPVATIILDDEAWEELQSRHYVTVVAATGEHVRVELGAGVARSLADHVD